MTTPSETAKTPLPVKEKENERTAETPLVNLPSSLKLGTPFLRGSRRYRDFLDNASSSSRTPFNLLKGKGSVFSEILGVESIDCSESICFPDELPLALFREELTPRNSSPLMKNNVLSNNLLDINLDSELASKPTTNPEQSLPEQSLPENNEPFLKPSQATISEEKNVDDDDKENSESMVQVEEQGVTAWQSDNDDFSSMIDFMAISFQEEIKREQEVLEQMLAGNSTAVEPARFQEWSRPSLAAERVNRLEEQLRAEREKNEKLLEEFADEREQLNVQMQEIQSHAELFVRMAREEAKQRIEEERATSDLNHENHNDLAVAEASRQAALLLNESRRRESELQLLMESLREQHGKEINKAVQRAQEEAYSKAEAKLSIEKAVAKQAWQKEIFDIETELLEILDELETTKEAYESEKKAMVARIVCLENQLQQEREKSRHGDEELKKEVEMFRVQLEVERFASYPSDRHSQCGSKNGAEENNLWEFEERINYLQVSLEEAERTMQTAKLERIREKTEAENEIRRLKTLAIQNQVRIQQSHTTMHELRESNQQLEGQYQKQSKEIVRLQAALDEQFNEAQATKAKLMEMEALSEKLKISQGQGTTENQIAETVDLFREFNRFHNNELNRVRTGLENDHHETLKSQIMVAHENGILKAVDFFRNLSLHKPATMLSSPSSVLAPIPRKAEDQTISLLKENTLTEKDRQKCRTAYFGSTANSTSALVSMKSSATTDAESLDKSWSTNRKIPVSIHTLQQETVGTNIMPQPLSGGSPKEVIPESGMQIDSVEESSINMVCDDDKCESNGVDKSGASTIPSVKPPSSGMKLVGRKTGLVLPQQSIRKQATAGCSIPSKGVVGTTGDSSAAEKLPLPRVTSLARQTPGSRMKRPQSMCMGSKENRRTPITKQAVSNVCSQSRLQSEPKSSIKSLKIPSGLPPRRTSMIPQTKSKPLQRSRPERTSTPKDRAGTRRSLSSNLPTTATRTLPNASKTAQPPLSSKRDSSSVASTRKEVSSRSITGRDLVSIRKNTPEKRLSQGVQDKFSSLYDVWSTTKKTPRHKENLDLPSSLQLDMRFDSCSRSTPLAKSFAERRASFCAQKQAVQIGTLKANPVSTFSMEKIMSSLGDDDKLLVSPIPVTGRNRESTSTSPYSQESIIRLQSIVRSFLAQMKYREHQKRHQHLRRVSTVIIQSYARRFLAQKKADSRKASVISIVCFSRRFLFNVRVTKRTSRQEASVKLQLAWRRYHKRRVELVVVIQSLWRQRKASLSYRISFKSIIRLQSRFRAIIYERQFHTIRRNVICLQKTFRQNKERLLFVHLRNASIMVQKWWRVHRVKHHRRVETAAAAVMLQRWARTRHAQTQFRALCRSVVTIQAHFRSSFFVTRFHLIKLRIVLVQSLIRRRFAMRKYQSFYKAITSIQNMVRIKIKRKAKAKEVSRKAAIKLQTWIRCARDIRIYREKREALIQIQAYFRATVSMSRFKSVRTGVVALQSVLRMKRFARDYQRLRRSVIDIQHRYRAKIALLIYRKTRNAAIAIQSSWRKKLEENRFRVVRRGITHLQTALRAWQRRRDYNCRKISVLRIQTYFRGVTARNEFLARRQSSVRIQRMWRQRYIALNLAAIKIQTWTRSCCKSMKYSVFKKSAISMQRRWIARKTHKNFKRLQYGTIKLQASFRRKRDRSCFIRFKRAVVCVQTIVRRFIQQRYASALVGAAVILQKQYRMYSTKKKFSRQREGFVRLQNYLRARNQQRLFLADRAAVRSMIKMQRSVIIVQAWARARLFKKVYSNMRIAVKIIQARWRAKSCRTTYKIARCGIEKLQSALRMRISMNILRNKKRALTILQRWWRVHHSEKMHESLTKAAIRIQSFWRRLTLVAQFRNVIMSSIKIQSLIRARFESKVYCSYLKSARLIQRVWRELLVRLERRACMKAAITVQSYWRARQICATFTKGRDAAIYLQSIFRKQNTRQHYLRVRTSVILAQRVLRGSLSRLHWKRTRRAVRQIQSVWRKAIAQSKYKILLKNVIKLQSHLRRYECRKIFLEKLNNCRNTRIFPEGSFEFCELTPLAPSGGNSSSTGISRRPLQRLPPQQIPMTGTKHRPRKPLGDVSSVFSPARTRGSKRSFILPGGEENFSNLTEIETCAKRQKLTTTSSTKVAYLNPEQMKVVDLRQALQEFGVKAKDIRRLRKAQLVSMLERIQKGGNSAQIVESVA